MTGAMAEQRSEEWLSITAVAAAGRTVFLLLFVVAVFSPFLVERFTSPSIFIVAVLWVAVSCDLIVRRARPIAFAAWLPVPILLLIGLYALSAVPETILARLNGLPQVLAQYAVVLPVAAAAGYVATRGGLNVLAPILRIAAAVNAPLALFERLSGRQIFSDNVVGTSFSTSAQVVGTAVTLGGDLRGIVASDHPLVLGALLVSVVPLVFRAGFRLLVMPEVLLLLAGAWATDSSGPLVVGVGAVVVLTALHWVPDHTLRSAMRPAGWLFLCALAVFAVVARFVWTPIVDSFSVIDESTQYRFALFALIPRIIAEHPFGFGLGDVPTGTLLIERTGPTLDVSVSVDSEPVLLVIQLGVIGAAAFAVVLWLAIRGGLLHAGGAFGLGPLLVMTLCGTVVALHVWPSIGSLWGLLIGISVGSARWRHLVPDLPAALGVGRAPRSFAGPPRLSVTRVSQ